MTRDEASDEFAGWIMEWQKKHGPMTKEQVSLAGDAWMTSAIIRARVALKVVESLVGKVPDAQLIEAVKEVYVSK